MNSTVILQQKCASMSFTELQAFKQLTNQFYNSLINDTNPGEDRDGYSQEVAAFNAIIDDIIANKVSTFLPQLV